MRVCAHVSLISHVKLIAIGLFNCSSYRIKLVAIGLFNIVVIIKYVLLFFNILV